MKVINPPLSVYQFLICFIAVLVPSLSFGEEKRTILYHFSEATNSGLPEGWQVNPSYPGKAVIDSDDGEAFVRLSLTTERPVGIIHKQSIEKEEDVYFLVLKARGEGTIEFGFSLWGEDRWIASRLSPRLQLHDVWTEYEVKLNIPKNITVGENELKVKRMIPSIYVRNGTADVKSLSIKSEP